VPQNTPLPLMFLRVDLGVDNAQIGSGGQKKEAGFVIERNLYEAPVITVNKTIKIV
jgi:hypothetical protein